MERIQSSRHHHMKDKSGAWNEWYEAAVPEADDLYDAYRAELKEEGLL